MREGMRVLLAGGEAAGVRALRLLTDRALPPVAVAAADDGMAAAAARATVEAIDPARLAAAETAQWIADQRIDLLLNAHSLHIVHGDVLAALRVGGYNLHPGPLPAYAGLNAPSWAIINGEDHHAVTLHEMTAEVDAGGIVATAEVPLDERSTGLSVSGQCARLGIALLEQLIEGLIAGEPVTGTPIVGERRLYRRRDRPYGGRVPWHEPATVIDRLVRGCSFHPMPSPIGTPTTTAAVGEVGLLSGGPVDGPPSSTRPTPDPGTVVGAAEGTIVVAAGRNHYRIDRVLVGDEPAAAAEVLSVGEVLGP
ncbi:MAG: formyltransferase family protein [Actinomycetota bacterium]